MFLHRENNLNDVRKIDVWPGGIRFAQWNNSAETDKEYPEEWVETISSLIEPGNAQSASLQLLLTSQAATLWI